MNENRRKIFYIDKLFQNKFLLLFLFLCISSVIANIFYLLLVLKKDTEDNLYRARIVISNVNDILIENIFYFNIILTLVMMLVVIIIYSFLRIRIQIFTNKLTTMLSIAKNKNSLRDMQIYLPKEFYGLNDVVKQFFDCIDNKRALEKEVIHDLKKFIDSPNEKSKQSLIEKIENIQ